MAGQLLEALTNRRTLCPVGYRKCGRRSDRRGVVTLTELLISLALVGMIALACGVLFSAAERAWRFAQSQASLMQEGQLSLERIRRAVEQAYTSQQFPGFIVLEETQAGWRFPQTLVVWNPSSPVDESRLLPRVGELVIFCPNPNRPEELLEVRPPENSSLCPPPSQRDRWRQLVNGVLSSPASERAVLTDRLRTVADPAAGPAGRRAGVFFFAMQRPSDDELAAFQAGQRSWNSLPWVQGIFGPHFGLGQHWLRIELQLTGGEDPSTGSAAEVIPFFGSVAVYYGIARNPP